MRIGGFHQRQVPAALGGGGGSQRAAGASSGLATVFGSGHTHGSGAPSGAHDHFDFVKAQPYTVLSAGMRSDADIIKYTAAVGRSMHSLDTVVDADRITFTSTSPDPALSLLKAQLWYNYLKMGQDVGHSSLSWQWEVMWDWQWLDTTLAGGNVSGGTLTGMKAFRVDYAGRPAPADERMLEMQTAYSRTNNTAVALPTVRVYGMTAGGTGENDPLKTLVSGSTFDIQPGGDTRALSSLTFGSADHLVLPNRPFVIRSNKWIRYTLTWYFDPPNPARVRLIMADQDNDPVIVIADPSNPALGFIADRAQPSGNNSDRFRIEFNSSQSSTPLIPFILWVRNVVIARNTPLPPGGRPIA